MKNLKFTTIKDLFKNDLDNNLLIKIIGRVKFKRFNKNIAFISLEDGTYLKTIQIVCKNSLIKNYLEIDKISIGSIVKIIGNLKLTPNSKQSFEILCNEIKILDLCSKEYPLQNKEHSNEFLRQIAYLRSRTNTYNAVFRIRNSVQFAIHKFFFKNNFVNVHTPIITANDAEGAGKIFTVTTINNDQYEKDFFGKKASLTVSGQLNAEALAQSFRKVYTFGPTFRAEKSNTKRHIAEFWMVEPEMAFCDIDAGINLADQFIRYVIEFVLKENILDLKYLNNKIDNYLIARLNHILKTPKVVISYNKAIEILKKANQKFESKIKWGFDLQTEHEKYISEKVYNGPVFIINYPKEIKSFYMKINKDNKTVKAFDLLVPSIGELIGGSQREDNYDKIKNICKEKSININDLKWYLNLRKFGYYKSVGFGLGFDRMVMYITGIKNIRDVIPFPRNPRSLNF